MLLQYVTGFTSYNRNPCGSLAICEKKSHPAFQTLKYWWVREEELLEAMQNY